MKKVYTGTNLPEAGLIQAMLQEAGIPGEVRGAVLHGLFGVGSGIDACPAVWIRNDEDLERAEALIQEHLRSDPEQSCVKAWTCPSCGEVIERQFKACWKCGK
ncbi:MAG: DUF2007 domain-containing protein [Elusimicrobiota bacterium]